MKNKLFICGNWKMHKTVAESLDFIHGLQATVKPDERCKIVIFPPYTALYALQASAGWIELGAQNMYYEEKGAFTGEISPLMLKELVKYVLIGHSERRQIFHEGEELLAKKLQAALKVGLTPIFCVGETLFERKEGRTFAVLERQLLTALDNYQESVPGEMLIAYEPIWAIGTGINATSYQAEEAHNFIKNLLEKKFSRNFYVLYGGSVKPANCHELLESPGIDGLLIGGASLQVSDFSAIIASAQKL